ncbi:MAG: hypothetical protein BWY22_01473 [Bacteroidetes bacterium ADurb.Bin217]|nr:MAG: hypothetical protein BWY22_01473 [Bacteroidetes bacterium ADurb.Bin217]
MIFYNLDSADKRGAIEIQTEIPFKTGMHIPSDSNMITNNLFEVSKGKIFYDTIMFSDSFEHFAISKKLKELLEVNNICGWTCFPIIIKNHDVEYFVFQPTFIAGEILNLNKVNNYEENLKFDLNTWNGAGIFSLKNTTLILCTEFVKDLITKNKITNITFEEIKIE